MPRVHLFNPENDLALAADVDNYTPPAAARRLSEAGELLPLYWADDGDLVLVDPSRLGAARRFAASVRPDVEVSSVCPPGFLPDPWGWSRDTRRRFLRAGVSAENLPSDAQLSLWRLLSHRRSTIPLNRSLGLVPPVEIFTPEEGLREVKALNYNAMLKLPWSSSGRGVFGVNSHDDQAIKAQIASHLRRQGSVMVEKRKGVENDFAALYYADGEHVEFKNLSLFLTEGQGGRYAGNLVASDADIQSVIGIDTAETVLKVGLGLDNLLKDSGYHGWIGVDMFTYLDSGHLTVNPCVEINLRRTMGVVARELYCRGHRGLLRVTPNIGDASSRPILPSGNFTFTLSESISCLTR